jgi:hypothetical protein
MDPTIDNTLIDQLLDPFTELFSPEAAKSIVDFRADSNTQSLIDELAEKANQGTATEQELAQYERLVDAATLIGIMQAKARKALRNGS